MTGILGSAEAKLLDPKPQTSEEIPSNRVPEVLDVGESTDVWSLPGPSQVTGLAFDKSDLQKAWREVLQRKVKNTESASEKNLTVQSFGWVLFAFPGRKY